MSDADTFDIVIIGSGPSGVQAATEAVKGGVKVCLVDVGFTDDTIAPLIPDRPFSEIRATDGGQHRYFVGDDSEGAIRRRERAGAHLTPPREHMIRDSEKLFPFRSETFAPIQATGLGGLAVSWGTNAFAYEDAELRRVGLPTSAMRPFYNDVARDIGISGSTNDDLAPLIADVSPVQPPLELDTNARNILARYSRSRSRFAASRFTLGQSLLAVLSEPLRERGANKYHDLDFYSDRDESAYRPRFTLRELKKHPTFTHRTGRLALRFVDDAAGPVRVECRRLSDGSTETIQAKRVVLAAGAINSARLALASLNGVGVRVPILCNPNIWIAALNLGMLGRPAADKRYSLAQLTALLRVPPGEDHDYVLGQFYSYRSLLLHRLLRSMPLPPRLGVLLLRQMLTSLTLVNIHMSDAPSVVRWMELQGDTMYASYERLDAEDARLRRNERRFRAQLIRLGCIPIGTTRPAHGASIHYAGTLPFSDDARPFTCAPGGNLNGASRVWVADGSSWRFLPAKGLTLTLMANARRVAREVLGSLNG